MTMQAKLMIEALQGKVTTEAPVWLMRQAGRYLPEYRTLRATAGSFMNLCFNPAYAAEVTLQPLRRFRLDAAILFSDILVIPHALGQDLSFREGEGPQLAPLSIDALDMKGFEEKLQPIYETVRLVRRDLSADKTLIGFAGAPWTVACYMVEGRGTGVFEKAREMMLKNPAAFDALVEKLVASTAQYLLSQIAAGVDCVQIFDSWAGLLSDAEFDRYSIAPTKRIVDIIREKHPGYPIIGFPRGAGDKYARYAAMTGVSAVGFDQRGDFAQMPKNICVQGNLDPEILQSGDGLEEKVEEIMRKAAGRPFIFNLGHGIIKETPPEHVARLVDAVKKVKRA